MLRKLVAGSLMRKLVTCFVIVSVAQILIVGLLSFFSAKSGLEQAAFTKLDSERELRRQQLLDYLIEAMQSIKFMAQTETARSNMETLRSVLRIQQAVAGHAFRCELRTLRSNVLLDQSILSEFPRHPRRQSDRLRRHVFGQRRGRDGYVFSAKIERSGFRHAPRELERLRLGKTIGKGYQKPKTSYGGL